MLKFQVYSKYIKKIYLSPANIFTLTLSSSRFSFNSITENISIIVIGIFFPLGIIYFINPPTVSIPIKN